MVGSLGRYNSEQAKKVTSCVVADLLDLVHHHTSINYTDLVLRYYASDE